jgi:hypothetical protein
MELILPFWFKQRQCKTEPAGDNVVKVTGPNLNETYLRIFADDGRWKAAVRTSADGPDVQAATDSFPTPRNAWDAAFELYRTNFIV